MKTVSALMLMCVVLSVNPLKSFSQKKSTVQKINNTAAGKKYPSLLWQITGNGLTQPSYLFGTMHISNKMVFNLSDSFYNAIKSADVVALEQNPEVWQEAYSKENFGNGYDAMSSQLFRNFNVSSKRLIEQTFSITNYESKIQLGLASEARLINGMLYRNNVGKEDFEEETYLDMYIYRLGRKLNKIVTGVEDYKESDKLVKEAYKDMYKEKKSRRSVQLDGYDYQRKMEDAYRKGDLDLLDSLQVVTSVSDAFTEKFLFKRNDIQANSIDTILKKHSLFVGVGAAHLPGTRGVIELLRKKGYTVSPVAIGQRNSEEKDKLEKIRVPLVFKRQFTEDSLFSVSIPGDKFFRFNSFAQTNMVQYADMANGSYYMVTRIKTDASLLGQSPATVLRKTDSLLYENVPGKMLSKKAISKDGFNGYDITNKTRKGDIQRYNIFVLPNELIILKVSGIADYVTDGKEAEEFLSSINFDTSINNNKQIYKPFYGGFAATFPSKPVYIAEERNDKPRSEWLAGDKNGNDYFIFKTTINQYDYIEEDTFELRLMEESFKSSSAINESGNGKTASWKGYPVLNAKYPHSDGSQLKIRYLIQGANYYIIGAKYKGNETAADDFINSFSTAPIYYGEVKERKDSIVGFTVRSPLFYPMADSADNFSLQDLYAMYGGGDEDEIGSYMDILKSMVIKTIGNDTTGERITLVSFHFPKYAYLKDSADFMKNKFLLASLDSQYIIKTKKKTVTPSNWHSIYCQATDTASSRVITAKSFYKNGVIFYIVNMGDSVTPPGEFVHSFFETFTPVDTFKNFNVFEKKTSLFFSEYFSTDTTISKKATQAINSLVFDSSDLPQIKKAITQLSWKNKNYLVQKKRWIHIAGTFKDSASANYLSTLYMQAKDTSDLQNAILDALLEMRTQQSFNTFKELLITEPPALADNDSDDEDDYAGFNMNAMFNSFADNETYSKRSAFMGYKWAPLYDTLALTVTILPDLLDMITLDDYKDDIIQLLTYAVDSGYVKADAYKQYFNKFLLEAKQQVKKQAAKEDEKEMDKLQRDDESDSYNYNYHNQSLNGDLENYATLLMPFWDRSAEVPALFNKLLQLKSKDAKLSIATLMLRSKKPVPDSVLIMLASEDRYRLSLYNQLKKANLTDKFPAQYKNQQSMATSALNASFYYAKMDSLVYIDKLQVNDAKNKGWLYFYKYKKSKDDKEWRIAYAGLQPLDTSKINSAFNAYKNDFIGYSRELYNAADVKQKMQQLLKENLYALRESSSKFYSRYDDEDMDAAVVDEVKGGRGE